MPASQHRNPKSDIEIAQAAKPRRIADLAQEKLGIAPENLEPYGHYKAKVSMDYVKSLKGRKNGKLILVTAITPTPAGVGVMAETRMSLPLGLLCSDFTKSIETLAL